MPDRAHSTERRRSMTVMENVKEVKAYGLRLLEHRPRYWCWDGGNLNRRWVQGRPGCIDGFLPKVSDINQIFCADLPTLQLRFLDKPVPKNHGSFGNFDGGTRSFQLRYGSQMRPFRLGEFREGDVAFVDFAERGPQFEGHIAFCLGDGPEARVLQSFAWSCRTLEPGLNAQYTLRESHDGGYYTKRIPREAIWG